MNDNIKDGEEDRRIMSNLVVSSSSDDTDQLVREEVIEVGLGVVYTGKWGNLLQIDFGDPRLCNKEETSLEKSFYFRKGHFWKKMLSVWTTESTGE